MSAVVSGPCESWITGAEVADCCNAAEGTDTSIFDDVAVAASMLLFEFSGRQFAGECEQTVRPCAQGCSCWADIVSPAQVPAVPWTWSFWGTGWGWGWDGCGDLCGCGSLSRALLPGYPVTEVLEVKIDGVVLDPSEYRLDGNRWLTRMANPTSLQPQFWPSCQRLDLDDDQPGTWSASYTFGQAVPFPGQQAAVELACQLYAACSGGDCALPVGVTQLTRQGVQIQRTPFINWAFQNGAWQTGLGNVDVFLQAYNTWGLKHRPSIWSPDLVPYGRLLGGSGS